MLIAETGSQTRFRIPRENGFFLYGWKGRIDTDKSAPRKGENAIERQIREAMDRGEFDAPIAKGKPLDLTDNPFTPEEWRLAYKLLKDAGVAPAWIEQDKAIRRETDTLALWLAQQAQWHQRQYARLKTLSPHKMIAERERLLAVRERTCETYRNRAGALNRLIDTFNLQAPFARLHHTRIQIEDEVARFLERCKPE
ncbi:MAG: DUF1992 domain-containing protein [Chloroflexi bacterium]|nr:DUF1992 domain-containing protein [Chloroflexota bacterium]